MSWPAVDDKNRIGLFIKAVLVDHAFQMLDNDLVNILWAADSVLGPPLTKKIRD